MAAFGRALALLAIALALSSMRAPARLDAVSAQVGAAAQIIPPAPRSRAKFPRSDRALVDKLALVNRFVNAAIIPVSDKDHYGVVDLWVMYPPDWRGDCDDFALTKLGILINNGSVTVATYKVVTARVHTPDGNFGHALLAIRLESGRVAYLDARFSDLMTRRELEARGYEFFDWRA